MTARPAPAVAEVGHYTMAGPEVDPTTHDGDRLNPGPFGEVWPGLLPTCSTCADELRERLVAADLEPGQFLVLNCPSGHEVPR